MASKSTGVTLDYTLVFTDLPKTMITSMTATQGPNISAGVTGGAGFTYPIFNGDASIKTFISQPKLGFCRANHNMTDILK